MLTRMPVAAERSPRRGNSTADRAIDILLLFDDKRLSLSVEEITEGLKTHRSTTYRYLQSLLSYALLEEDLSGGYRLGSRVLQLARLCRRGTGLTEVALPVMRELAQETGETVLLTRLFGNQVICVERVDRSDQPVRIVYERGQVLPLTSHMGASARILLAHLSSDAQRLLLQGVPGLPLAATLRELAQIRQAGYVVAGPDAETYVRGIAAPVFGAEPGVAVAGLGLAGPSFRVPDELLNTYVELVTRAAASMSADLAAIDA